MLKIKFGNNKGARLIQGGLRLIQGPSPPPLNTPLCMCVCVKPKLERITGNTICGYFNMNRKFNK